MPDLYDLDDYRINMVIEELLAALWLIGYSLAAGFGHEFIAAFCLFGFVCALVCYVHLAVAKHRAEKAEKPTPNTGESSE